MATTIALVAVDGDQAIIGHVGDSRVYRFNGQSLTCETEDHSEVHEAVREGLLSADQAALHPRRNVINRALGVEPEVEPDYKTSPIDGRTGFLLCSDGITRHVSDSEIEEIFRNRIHPDYACNRLKELCYARGAEDNLTAVVIDFGEREYADEPTHPSRAAPGAQLPASRIEVAFRPGAVDDNHQPSEQPMPEESMPQRS
jgi:protein phosphatase